MKSEKYQQEVDKIEAEARTKEGNFLVAAAVPAHEPKYNFTSARFS